MTGDGFSREPVVTVGFSSHHVEALPFAEREMKRHRLIVLEEPPLPHFSAMLEGQVSIEDYLLELESGFPEFERQMCGLLQHLHREGRRLVQVEPYLERLLRVHELFAAGKSPEEVIGLSALRQVYLAEKEATGALIAYYQVSLKGSFAAVVEAVNRFARADAARLSLRQRLRARAIGALFRPGEPMYVEAGYIHYPLSLYLRRLLRGRAKIRVVFLLAPVVRSLGGKRRNLGPGDILTLHYCLHGGLRQDLANLLAARSLIYIKLIQKDELRPGISAAPHSEDEVMVNRLVDRLQFWQCRELFGRIRLAGQKRALQLARAYVEQTSAGRLQ